MNFANIASVIENVVISMREAGHDEPYFEYGHALEIVNTLMEKDKNDEWKLKKYPAIFLFMPVKENRDNLESEAKLRILFVTETRPEWKAKDRDANVFTPVLIPLYEMFMRKLRDSFELYYNESQTYDFTKHYYWGSSQTNKNVANDFADAIEIEGLNITIPTKC